MSLGSKIKELLAERGISEYGLAGKTGIPRSTINKISNDKRKAGAETFLKLARAFNIPVDELYEAAGYDIGTKGERREETPDEILERLRLAQPVRIPVYPEFVGPHAGEEHAEPVEYIYLPRAMAARRHIEAYVVHGRCMEPDIRDKDIVIVDRDLPGEPGKIALCLLEGELVMGRIVARDNELRLRNSDEEISLTDCQVSAVVIEVTRRLM